MDLTLGDQLVLASIGGIVGTAAMDAAKYVGHRMRLIGGVRMDMLGRWALGMLVGRFVHEDIHGSPVQPGEVSAGWIFHYFTGVIVAWMYPFFALAAPPGFASAVVFGLCTSVLPWFMVYPAFGKGWFGSKAPKTARPVLTSIVSHTFYGAGIGAVFMVVA